MAKSNSELAAKMVDKGGKMSPMAIQHKLSEWSAAHRDKLVALAGSDKEADKVFVTCMSVITRTPALMECEFTTVAACILQSFQLNLFPGPFQECAYVPLKNGKTGRKEANFWLQYPGLVKLLINAGNKCVVARVVHEGDFFEYREGLEPPLYAPACVVGKTRGERLFAYAAVCTPSNLWQVEVMSPEQIESIKSRSKGAKFNDSPWQSQHEDDVDAMWSKTVLKRISKWLRKSAELAEAIEEDNKIDGLEVSGSRVLPHPLSNIPEQERLAIEAAGTPPVADLIADSLDQAEQMEVAQ